jgi:plasmid stabilization system protein ParE
VTHRVIWREQAVADLRAIFYSISDQADAEVALRFVQRIEAAGEKLTDFRSGVASATKFAPACIPFPSVAQ